MIVTKESFPSILDRLLVTATRAVDCETTGLKWYDHNKLFSLIIADGNDSYYFNFNDEPDHLGEYAPEDKILPREWLQKFRMVFSNPDSLWFAHNAKFDLAMLAREGLWVAGGVHCTEVMARLLRSDHMKYNLAFCVERMAEELKIKIAKDGDVADYVKKHKLYEEVTVEGKSAPIQEMHYHKVPFAIIAPYGVTDGAVTYQLGQYQLEKFRGMGEKNSLLWPLIQEEMRLTKTALKMALAGVPYDPDYVQAAQNAEINKLSMIEKEYRGLTGNDYVDSGVQFAEYFAKENIPYKKTEKGNPRFDEYALDSMPEHPVVDLIKAHRDSNKKVSTYYSSLLYYGTKGKIHADMRQAGTATGRVSYRDPNMQNVPKEEDPNQDFRVRACFVPLPGGCLFMPDYDQMEYRMMLDEAEEMDTIKLIRDNGLDVHEAAAQLMGVPRGHAKTINFLLLYGGGAQKLANALGVPLKDAYELKNLYFARLPYVKKWINGTIYRAKLNGYVKNWDGRICRVDRDFAYKAPNYRIQGGSAGTVKRAMNLISKALEEKKTKMVLQVHDELLFTMPKDELDLAPQIVKIMESVYPYKHLPLTVGPGHSWANWADKKDGYPAIT